MSAASHPEPGDTTELESLRREFTRTPRPYLYSHDDRNHEDGGLHRGAAWSECDRDHGRKTAHDATAEIDRAAVKQAWQRAGQESTAGSESGTEADDERPSLVKALPPATLRPRKGLKTGEEDQDALLTPSQLDEKERGYFREEQTAEVAAREKEREEVQKRRFAEFVRRSSEVALMGVILIVVLCGQGVAQLAWQWTRELLSGGITTIALIVAYPVKLSIVDTRATKHKLWQRFRVPASFDPATVLYPPLLPVLVALSVGPKSPAVVLPNIILGLASLPQRLFPRSSRLAGVNVVHWLVSIIPLVISEHTDWPSKTNPLIPYALKTPRGLPAETLVSLYPLHHALLVPLHYLTTTSLLISEAHLLSVVLINLLLLASSPQVVILKACLWVGGVCLFVACGHVLHWNVTLARVPRWKLRRAGHTAEERKSLVDAVSDLINLQRAAGAFEKHTGADSDADEDEPKASFKHKPNKSANYNGMPKLNTAGLVIPAFGTGAFGPQSAIEPRQLVHGIFTHTRHSSTDSTTSRPRRNTVPERELPAVAPERQPSGKRRAKSSNLLWCLQLTPEQAQRRKWLYAGITYLATVATIMVPVKLYVAHKALHGQEPIGWALSYLFGQIPVVRRVVHELRLQHWIPLPSSMPSFTNISMTFPLEIDLIRDHIGPSNVRLLLIAYWALVLIVGLLAVSTLTEFVEVDTRRKVFHGVMVAMLLPATFIDPCYCALALAIALAVFLLLEVLRAGQVPPLGNAISRFVAPYVDGRDLRGPVVVSHIFLLIGCAVPLWFSLASIDRLGDGWEVPTPAREAAMVAGVICVGMGDAAASLIGRRYGRRKWIWVGGKSLEGSAAFAAAVTLGLMAVKAWEVWGGWSDFGAMSTRWAIYWTVALCKAVFCACGASFMEAVLTGANDNVVVPMALWLLVRGVRF